ncbi:hypothetical protein [Paenibacillus piri]|uniref:Uncharacterized protein n=1 Tax=Paenibacillus piri TaxID=2547395 RepID=A0A4R5KGE1_9BACL|nr:hypothetical protein [Paenibacillus piri]TDF94451.1 hypothetical protein E1757_23875 [Paenibacillus piri]
MRHFNFSIFKVLRLLAIFVFDAAVVLAFFKLFSVLLLAAPVKFAFMTIILLTGLLFFNVSVLSPRLLLGRSGIAYPIAVVILSLVYIAVSNFISVVFLTGSTIWYLCWELLIFAGTAGTLSVFGFFASREDNDADRLENTEKTTISMQLMLIEQSLISKQNDETLAPIIQSFKALKERIQASTPFGRITGNSAVYELENTIRDNLEFLQLHVRSNTIDKNLKDIQNLIEETRRLIISREALNVR